MLRIVDRMARNRLMPFVEVRNLTLGAAGRVKKHQKARSRQSSSHQWREDRKASQTTNQK
jgi:hypothetical protein